MFYNGRYAGQKSLGKWLFRIIMNLTTSQTGVFAVCLSSSYGVGQLKGTWEMTLHTLHLLTHMVSLAGASWVTMFQHKGSEGLFKVIDVNTGLLKFEPNPNTKGHQSLSRLERLGRYQSRGVYHLKLCYPSVTGGKECSEWQQTSNPVEEEQVTDFTPLSLVHGGFQVVLPS